MRMASRAVYPKVKKSCGRSPWFTQWNIYTCVGRWLSVISAQDTPYAGIFSSQKTGGNPVTTAASVDMRKPSLLSPRSNSSQKRGVLYVGCKVGT